MRKIGVFGSCRVHSPVKLAATENAFKYLHDDIVGYLHNSKEVVQAIKILKGELYVFDELRPFLNFYKGVSSPPANYFSSRFNSVTAFVVELSSIRVIRYRGFYLQIHRLREALMAYEGGEEFSKNLHGHNLRSLQDAAAEFISLNRIHGLLKDIILNAELFEQTGDEISQDILVIRELIGAPVLYVGPFVKTADNRPVKQRLLISNTLTREAQSKHAIGFFDPTTLVDEVGYYTALIDSGHYQKSFEQIAGHRMLNELNIFLEKEPNS